MILDDGGDATLLMHLGSAPRTDLSRARQPRTARRRRSSSPPSSAKLAEDATLVQPHRREHHRA
jgi:hypothetical protein